MLLVVVLAFLLFGFSFIATAEPVGIDHRAAVEGQLISYGSDPSTFGRLWVPASRDGDDLPVVVLIHGGFWRRQGGDLSLMTPMARDLYAEGYAIWNMEYGRVGEGRGGWPYTFDHVGAGVDHLAILAATYRLDIDRVAVVGHSAGGQLAMWAMGRDELRIDDPGSSPVVEPSLAIALAPVFDLPAAALDGLGNNAVGKLLGGLPADVPDRYRVAMAPVPGDDVHVLLGELDDTVPSIYSAPGKDDFVSTVPGVDHLALIDPTGEAGAEVRLLLSRWE